MNAVNKFTIKIKEVIENISYGLRKSFTHRQLYKRGAYHEAGHVTFAYLYDYTCNFTELIKDEPGNGRTEFVFGQYKGAVNMILKQLHFILNELNEVQQQYIIRQAHYLSMIFCAGACAEAYFFKPFWRRQYRPILSSPDLDIINAINGLIGQIYNNPTMVTLRKALCFIENFEGIRITIEAIATELLNSPNKRIDDTQIQKIITNTNFIDTRNNVINYAGYICR